MISILVCSVNDTLFKAFEQNVAQTIGCKYELIYHKNIKKENLCQVYEKLKSQAKGEYLCFVHEDVIFKTQNWGLVLEELFVASPQLGLLGLAGSIYKSSIPSGWYIKDSLSASHLIQNNKEGTMPYLNHLGFADHEKTVIVTNIDGVFMALHRKVADKVHFNTQLKGFHAYDTDLSMAVIDQGYKVAVCKGVLLEHFSEGTPNNEWLKNHIVCNKRWKHLLPLVVCDQVYVHKSLPEIDNHIQWYFVDCMSKFGFSRLQQLKHVIYFSTPQTRKRTINFLRSFALNSFKWSL